MQLRRAVPLSLVVLLASAGCVSVSPEGPLPVPPRGPVPPAGASDVPLSLPLGKLPGSPPVSPAEAPAADPEPESSATRAAKARTGKAQAPPRRARPQGPATAHPRRGRLPAPPPAAPALDMDGLCAAAEGSVPPSIVDLCLRQAGR